jgi:hypothetical protein
MSRCARNASSTTLPAPLRLASPPPKVHTHSFPSPPLCRWRPTALAAQSKCGVLLTWDFLAQKKQASKRPSPAPPVPLQVIPPSAHPIYEPIDLAHLPPPPKPILDRSYVAAENLDFDQHPSGEIKQLLGVSQYPVIDLSKELPGIPPTDDFSKVKVQNQTSYDTWLKTIETYFRPFSEDDLTFLRQQVYYPLRP